MDNELSRDVIEQRLARCALANLRKAMRAVTQLYDDALAPSGLRSTQFGVLATIRLRDGASMSHLAQHLVMDRTTLTRNLQPLEREGLLRISPGRDARTRLITLTEKGHDALRRASPLRLAAQQRLEAALGSPRYDALIDHLQDAVAAAVTESAASRSSAPPPAARALGRRHGAPRAG